MVFEGLQKSIVKYRYVWFLNTGSFEDIYHSFWLQAVINQILNSVV